MSTSTEVLEKDDLLDAPSPLRAALPGAPFTEQHGCVVAASPDDVWDIIHELRWIDLWLTAPLMAVRTGGRLGAARGRIVDAGSPIHPVAARRPEVMASAMIGRPWANEMGRDVSDLDDLAEFDEPGWLKYGMEFRLTPIPGGRTYVDTSTVCATTDPRSHRRFRAYWTIIRPFSGLIRRDILRALRTRASRVRGRLDDVG